MTNEGDLKRGRSEAINLTITEIMEFLGDNAKRPGGTGADLRAFLHRKIADLGEHWYKRGVRRGRMESYPEWSVTGRVSRRFRYKGKREFFEGQIRRVRITLNAKAEQV